MLLRGGIVEETNRGICLSAASLEVGQPRGETCWLLLLALLLALPGIGGYAAAAGAVATATAVRGDGRCGDRAGGIRGVHVAALALDLLLEVFSDQ